MITQILSTRHSCRKVMLIPAVCLLSILLAGSMLYVQSNRGLLHPAAAEKEDPNKPALNEDGTLANRLYEETPITKLRIGNLSPQVETDMDYVDWWYSPWEDCHYIFLPATANRDDLSIEVEVTDGNLALNGQSLNTTPSTNLLNSADEFELTVGETNYGILKVMQSDLNVIYFSTSHGGTDWIDAHKSKTETAVALMLTETGEIEYCGDIASIKSHGNSSWDYSKKKPYNIKLPQKSKLYGMGKAKKWVMMSNYTDQSMLRNTVALDMGKQAGIRYTMQSTYCDFYVDGSYRGTYQLYEKVQIQKHRVNITDLEEATEACNEQELNTYPQKGINEYELDTCKYYDIPNNPEDITGGYLIQFQLYNRYKGHAESGFVTTRGQAIDITSPQYASQAQVEYIRSFVQDLEDAIYSETGYNEKGKHYSDYIDVDSLILGYLVQEITQNPDATFASFFLWKDSDLVGDGKLHYGPAWDFDMGFYNFSRAIYSGITGDPDSQQVHYSGRINELFAAYFPISGYDKDGETGRKTCGYGWLMTLIQKPEFGKRVSEIYFDSFDAYLGVLSDSSQPEGALITQYGNEIRKSADMNNARWHMYGAKPYKVWGPFHGNNHEECVEFVRSFVERRRAFLKDYMRTAMTDYLTADLDAELERMELSRYDSADRCTIDEIITTAKTAIAEAETVNAAEDVLNTTLEQLRSIPKTEVSGDFNDSLDVDVRDAYAVMVYYARSLVGLYDPITPTQFRNGDVDKNGKVDIIDAMHILRHYASVLALKNDYPLPVVDSDEPANTEAAQTTTATTTEPPASTTTTSSKQ